MTADAPCGLVSGDCESNNFHKALVAELSIYRSGFEGLFYNR